MRERDLLQHVYAHNARLPGSVRVPPGDDMAVVSVGGADVLVTVDQVADGVHVDCATMSVELIGRKAITRNLSDVAAMAALPAGAVAAACLPRDFGTERANRLFDAMSDTAQRYGCPLLGGDISMWDHPLLLTVTVLAEPAGVAPVLRSGAKAGDAICVTGRLGGAWAGKGGGESGGGAGGGSEPGGQPHLRFEPRVELARKIATIKGLTLHSMIDISDGLATDLGHICEASGVAAEIDPHAVPVREEARAAAARDGRPGWLHALTDGEDYELCFTLSTGDAERRLPDAIDGVPITRIGRILDRADGPAGPPVWLRWPDGRREPITEHGWEHTA